MAASAVLFHAHAKRKTPDPCVARGFGLLGTGFEGSVLQLPSAIFALLFAEALHQLQHVHAADGGQPRIDDRQVNRVFLHEFDGFIAAAGFKSAYTQGNQKLRNRAMPGRRGPNPTIGHPRTLAAMGG